MEILFGQKKMGGVSSLLASDIRLDKWGNIYLEGRFSNTVNFDPGNTNFSLTSAGSSDVYMCKLSSSGNFRWAKRMGGTDLDWSNKFCVSPDGIIYITGAFRNTVDFDPNAGVQNFTSNGTNDIFLAKYDSAGSLLMGL